MSCCPTLLDLFHVPRFWIQQFHHLDLSLLKICFSNPDYMLSSWPVGGPGVIGRTFRVELVPATALRSYASARLHPLLWALWLLLYHALNSRHVGLPLWLTCTSNRSLPNSRSLVLPSRSGSIHYSYALNEVPLIYHFIVDSMSRCHSFILLMQLTNFWVHENLIVDYHHGSLSWSKTVSEIHPSTITSSTPISETFPHVSFNSTSYANVFPYPPPHILFDHTFQNLQFSFDLSPSSLLRAPLVSVFSRL